MGEIRDQVDQAMTGASWLDPDRADHEHIRYTSPEQRAIASLITAVRILADQLDAH
jgi:hypothetical protein